MKVRAGVCESSVEVGHVGELTFGGTMTVADIPPFFLVALIALATLSLVRSHYRQSGRQPARIPVRFEAEGKPRHVEVRRPAD